jgi:hypothetical protein
MTRKYFVFTFHLIFYVMQRRLVGSLPVMGHGVFNRTRKQKGKSKQWKTQNSPWSKKARMSKSHVKNMLVCFFDQKGIVQYEFVDLADIQRNVKTLLRGIPGKDFQNCFPAVAPSSYEAHSFTCRVFRR